MVKKLRKCVPLPINTDIGKTILDIGKTTNNRLIDSKRKKTLHILPDTFTNDVKVAVILRKLAAFVRGKRVMVWQKK